MGLLKLWNGTQWVPVGLDHTHPPGDPLQAARLSATSAQTISHNNDTELIQLTTRVYAFGTIHTLGSSSFVAPTSGLYRMGAQVLWTSNANGFRYLRIRINQSRTIEEDRRGAVSGSNTVSTVSTEDYLAAGDLVTFNVYHNAGAGVDLSVFAGADTHAWISRAPAA